MGVMIQYIRIYLLWPIQGVPTTNEIYLLIPPLGVGYRGSLTSPAGALYSAAPVITVQSRDLENEHFYAFLKNANAVRGVGASIN